MSKKSFASDNYTGVHPKILQAINEANRGDCPAYGADAWTAKATELFKHHFGSTSATYFVMTGTAANVLGLHAVMKPHQAIICADTAHIQVDECGAPEKYLGSKLLTVASGTGKLTVDQLKPFLSVIDNQHHVQPKVISLTQPTELGTVYSLDELKKITDFAHAHNLLVHMDGARLCNAVAYLGCSFEDVTRHCGIDLLSFGGTKNGMMFGEAVIFFDAHVAADFKYIRKQGMQLLSKMRFISAQFNALLSDNLWLENARQANNMAQLLVRELEAYDAIDLAYPVQANAVFARLDRKLITALQEEYQFYVWNELTNEVRWMTSFNTQQADITAFVNTIKRFIQ